MKKWFSTIAWGALLLLVIAAVIGFDVFRWNMFNDMMGTDVSYWKWRFIIDVKK